MEATMPRKKGPIPQGYANTHIQIEPDLLAWGKQQPGGFAALVRKLVRDARDREQRKQQPSS
jgi:hypothetical protein